MKNHKNYIIAILTGLLALTLSTQNSNGAPVKTYDAVKLIQYDRCLDRVNQYYRDSSLSNFAYDVSVCSRFKP